VKEGGGRGTLTRHLVTLAEEMPWYTLNARGDLMLLASDTHDRILVRVAPSRSTGMAGRPWPSAGGDAGGRSGRNLMWWSASL